MPNYRTSLSAVLIENSSYNRRHLKQRLIKEKLLEYKCVKCGNIGEWEGSKLTLQLEHRNGVNNDNRLFNLCFLCPNCHSQTPTFSGRNCKRRDKEKKACLNCGVDTYTVYCSKRCSNQRHGKLRRSSAYNKIRKVQTRPTKEALIQEVLSSNFFQVGKKYGISDNAVRKWLVAYGLSRDEIKSLT